MKQPKHNPLRQLAAHGQSAWLDQLQRVWLDDGQLTDYIAEDDLRGVTSNPSIFQAAIGGSHDYDDQLTALTRLGLTAAEIYDRLTMDDIQATCDIFRAVYDRTGGLDGFVSHEVSPALAHDTRGTIHEAERLWRLIDRPNLMVKIPATAEGLPAIQHCLTVGININITLMFSLRHYDAVAEAYLAALEARAAAGSRLDHVASVASFFVSRVDTHVDALLDSWRAPGGGMSSSGPELLELRGRAAVANSKRAYRRFQELFTGARWAALEARGARVQRLLWASTSTKDRSFRDVKYVEDLIGAHTVNTIPLATFDAFREHGVVADTLTADWDEADHVVNQLGQLGIDLNAVGEILSREGVAKFNEALAGVLKAVEGKMQGG